MALLQINNLTRSPFLKPVTLALEAGECIGIEGPSGSGKSVLLRAIADLDPTAGAVTLKDASRSAMPAPSWRSKVCYMASEPAWWAERVGDHFPHRPEGARLAEALGLPGAMNWEVSRLSTGEGQRLALARAMAIKPDILLLDEPSSGLDAEAKERVIAEIGAFIDAGRSVFLVSHDPAVLDALATRRYRMDAGALRDAA